jgi:predicted MPP superfamily phosphohydrolase
MVNYVSFHWLHFSDLHLTSTEYFDTNAAKRRLLTFLKTEITAGRIKCDYLFLTGDIANTCKYDDVENFIVSLFKVLELDKDDYKRAFWAVGNHDISRGSKLRNDSINTIRSSKDRSKEFEDSMRDNDTLQVLTKTGMDKYREYHQKLLNRPSADIHAKYSLPNLNLIVLNTCLTSCNDDDEMRLHIADQNFYSIFEKLDDSKPTFVIGHHALRFFTEKQQNRINSTFDGSCPKLSEMVVLF